MVFSVKWHNSVLMWTAFVVVSIWLGWQGYVAEAVPYGDVSFVYEFWAGQAAGGSEIVGLQTQWVYPIAALIPILLPLLAGPGNYPLGWIMLVTLLNAGAFAYLLYSGQKSSLHRVQRTAAWWWLAFLALLGPIGVSRLESIVTPLAIVGLLAVVQRPALAGALLAFATWIKVWPAALIAAVIISVRQRRTFILAVLVTSAVIVAIALILGGGASLLSFLGQQSGRGLQIESPFAMPFLWLASAGQQGFAVYYDTDILTFQVMGDGTAFAAETSTMLLALSFIAILLWGIWLSRQGSAVENLVPALALALTVALIVFNKVGSPQYIGWLATPVVAGLVWSPQRFKVAGVVTLILAALTQLFYPYMYGGLLEVQPLELSILTLRNAGEIVLLGLALKLLYDARLEDRLKKWQG